MLSDPSQQGDVLQVEEGVGQERRRDLHGAGGDGSQRLGCIGVPGYIPRERPQRPEGLSHVNNPLPLLSPVPP